MTRFVILHHRDWPGQADHYDLMLELYSGQDLDEPALKTFSTLREVFPDGRSHADPRARGETAGDPTGETNLFRLGADHRRAYLSFEGLLSGDRGRVARVEEGTLSWLADPAAGGLELRFRLEGRRLNGDFRLRYLGSATYVLERLKRG